MNTEENYLWRADQDTPDPDPGDFCECGAIFCRHGRCWNCEGCEPCGRERDKEAA